LTLGEWLNRAIAPTFSPVSAIVSKTRAVTQFGRGER
jgi:hypothetical protein